MFKSKQKFTNIHHADQPTIDQLYNEYSPVFILTTGRSGSGFMNKLFSLSPEIVSYHEPQPTLQFFSNQAYHSQKNIDILTKMIDASRMELILDVYINDKIYVESNQCMTFFCTAISNLFKKSKFIHIVRHPGDFIRSAIMKGWHRNDTIWESGRVQMKEKKKWEAMSHIKKMSWVWNTTNEFIEVFKTQISTDRIISINIEKLFIDIKAVEELYSFIGVHKIKESYIEKVMGEKVNELVIAPEEPPNMKKIHDYPKYNKWDTIAKNDLRLYSEKLANFYGYYL